jgi:hypothetical protein
VAAVKDALIRSCELFGIDPSEERSWDIIDQLDKHRATIVVIRCGVGRSGTSFRFKVLLAYHRSVFIAHRDVTAALGRVFSRSQYDPERGQLLIYGPTMPDAKTYFERQLNARFAWPTGLRFEWL